MYPMKLNTNFFYTKRRVVAKKSYAILPNSESIAKSTGKLTNCPLSCFSALQDNKTVRICTTPLNNNRGADYTSQTLIEFDWYNPHLYQRTTRITKNI